MLFQIDNMWQLLGWILVFAGLVITNEIERRTKWGGIFFFGVILGVLTVYFVAIQIGANAGAAWALNNPTYIYNFNGNCYDVGTHNSLKEVREIYKNKCKVKSLHK